MAGRLAGLAYAGTPGDVGAGTQLGSGPLAAGSPCVAVFGIEPHLGGGPFSLYLSLLQRQGADPLQRGSARRTRSPTR